MKSMSDSLLSYSAISYQLNYPTSIGYGRSYLYVLGISSYQLDLLLSSSAISYDSLLSSSAISYQLDLISTGYGRFGFWFCSTGYGRLCSCLYVLWTTLVFLSSFALRVCVLSGIEVTPVVAV